MGIDTMFTMFPYLSTERLQLRPIQPEDAEALFMIFSDAEAMQFYGHEPHTSLSETRETIRQIAMRYAQGKSVRWGITLSGEERLIGTCSFHNFDEGYHRAETGYDLQRMYWGKGFMLEAMTSVLNYGFTELNLNRIEAIIDIANLRSRNLLLRLGFVYEGLLRQRYAMNNRFLDEYFYGLLKDEWVDSI